MTDNQMTAEQALSNLLEANKAVNYMSIMHFIHNWLGGEDKVREIIAALSAPRVPEWEIDWSKAPAGTQRAIHDESTVTWLKMSPGRGVMSWRWHARAWYLHTNTEVANAMWESAIPKPEPAAAAEEVLSASPEPVAQESTSKQTHIAFTEKHVSYVERFGGNCRDCADEKGICPSDNMPCAGRAESIKYVLRAIEYGVNHGFVESPLSDPEWIDIPANLRRQTNLEQHAQQVIDDLRAEVEALKAKLPDALEPVEGDQLPPVGSKVLIHLGREDEWAEHTVVGYYAWPGLNGNPSLHRVFVRVRSDSGSLNVRMLKDVRQGADQ